MNSPDPIGTDRHLRHPLVRKSRRVASVARDLIYTIADAVVALLGSSCRQGRRDPRGRERLAIVMVHGIGDLVIWRGALQRLGEMFPAGRFETTFFCTDGALDFARSFIGADHFLPIDRQKFRTVLPYRERILFDVARRNFSIAIQPTLNRYFLVEDALVRATGAKRRIGSSGTPLFLRRYERRLSDRWYSQIVPAAPVTMHDLDRSAEFLRGLGLSVPALPLARLASPKADRREEPGYVVVGVSSSSHLKTWPIARFEEAAHEIAERTGRRIVFCGDPGDADLRSRFGRWRDRQFVDRVGETSLDEFLTLLSGADLIVSNDSGTVHLGFALRRPTVTVLGGGLVGRYHPYPASALGSGEDPGLLPVAVSEQLPCFDCGWHCRFAVPADQPAPCIDRVSASSIVDRVVTGLRAA